MQDPPGTIVRASSVRANAERNSSPGRKEKQWEGLPQLYELYSDEHV